MLLAQAMVIEENAWSLEREFAQWLPAVFVLGNAGSAGAYPAGRPWALLWGQEGLFLGGGGSLGLPEGGHPWCHAHYASGPAQRCYPTSYPQ